MKKLFFATALVLGGLSTYAINAPVVEKGIVKVNVQDEFKPIELSEVPQAVIETLSTEHPEFRLIKAFVNEKQIYKLEVTSDQGETAILFADKDGKLVKQ